MPSHRPRVGDIKMSAVAADHSHWLMCDGRELARAAYPRLYTVVGDAYGAACSDLMFKLPDMRGRVPGAAGPGAGLTSRAIGDALGEETHTLTLPELAAHNHGGTTGTSTTAVSTVSSGAHTHTTNATGGTLGLSVVTGHNTQNGAVNDGAEPDQYATPPALVIDSAGAHTHAITDPGHAHAIASAGGGQAHNNMQPTLFVGNSFIFAGPRAYPASGDRRSDAFW